MVGALIFAPWRRRERGGGYGEDSAAIGRRTFRMERIVERVLCRECEDSCPEYKESVKIRRSVDRGLIAKPDDEASAVRLDGFHVDFAAVAPYNFTAYGESKTGSRAIGGGSAAIELVEDLPTLCRIEAWALVFHPAENTAAPLAGANDYRRAGRRIGDRIIDEILQRADPLCAVNGHLDGLV